MADVTGRLIVEKIDEWEHERDAGKNSLLITDNYARWLRAMELAKILIEKGKFIKAEFEDPDERLIWHGCITYLADATFKDEEVQEFAEFLTMFDEVSPIGDSEGNIELSLLTRNLYK